MTELAAGMMVSPNIRLERLLGKGGMGSVWVAQHLALDTQVAVKFISAELAKKDPTLIPRFRREAKSAAKIRSPHVVEIKDYGLMDDDRPYMVMERLEGESLADLLSREGRLSLRKAGMLVAQVAEALEAAHDQGIVHRDIKPDNLFLMKSGYGLFTKVLDFGIAKIRQDARSDEPGLTQTGALVGTPEFMSPEQVEGEPVDHRSDLWSLGIVAYAALTGTVPFTGNSMGAICIAIAKATFEPPSCLRPGLSVKLDTWFERALSRNPDDRFQSAGELAEAFVDVILRASNIDSAAPSTASPLDQLSRLAGSTPPPARSRGTAPGTGADSADRPATAAHEEAKQRPAGPSSSATSEGGETTDSGTAISAAQSSAAATGSSPLDDAPAHWSPLAGVAAVAAVFVAGLVVLFWLAPDDGPSAATTSASTVTPQGTDTPSSTARPAATATTAVTPSATTSPTAAPSATPRPSAAPAPPTTATAPPPRPPKPQPTDGWETQR